MKKYLMRLSISALLLNMNVATFALPNINVNGVKYSIDETNGYAEVIAVYSDYDGYEYSGDIVISSEIEYNGTKYPVKRIGPSAFFNSDITSVTIPNTVTDFDYCAFGLCGMLKSIDIPNSVVSIGEQCFTYCGLTSISIPNSVERIGDKVFWGCESLKTVYIGNSLIFVGETPFFGCDIETFEYHCNLRWGVFFEEVSGTNKNLKTVIVGDEVETVGGFDGFRKLTDVRLGKNVSALADYSFFDCESLTNIELPKSLKSIGTWAFGECFNLTTIKSHNPTPLSLGKYVFPKSLYNDATLYVPKGSKDLYKERWGFSKIIEFDEAITNISTYLLDNKHEDRIYNLYGVQIDSHNLTKGIYIKNGKKVLIK